MPRYSKGPHLWKRPARRKNRRVVANAVWIIKDNGKHFATGCVATPTEQGPPLAAQQALQKYIASKYEPERRVRDIDHIDLADVLSIYYADTKERQSSRKQFASRISRLNQFFGSKKLSQISHQLCNEYVKGRENTGGARRDLEDLRAAINHHRKQNFHHANVHVTLPKKGQARDRWLTRDEMARLLWTCWRAREIQTVHRGPQKGQKIPTEKYPLRHLARFILIGMYTGTRAATIAAASPYRDTGHSFVDLNAGIFYRLPQGKQATNKRQPPVPIPDRLLVHMKRWVRTGAVQSHFVEWNGEAVKSVKTAFATAVRLAKLSVKDGNVTPHTLRHSAATWLMQRGADPWQAAGYLGMSLEVLLNTYGHHHPDHLHGAATAITSKDRKKNMSGG